MRRLLPVVLFFACVHTQSRAQNTPPSPAQSTIDKLSAADLARGRQLYENQCSVCHGQTGTGGKGARLAQPTLHRAPTDNALAEVIKNGISGTEMPAAWQMTDREIWQVAGYVRSLGRIPVVPLPGDAARGRTLYESKGGCAACHIVSGSGNALGPELTEIGARRSADYLREALVNPGATVPEQFLVISATTRDGKTIRGERITEDTFTIQLRDASGRLESRFARKMAPLGFRAVAFGLGSGLEFKRGTGRSVPFIRKMKGSIQAVPFVPVLKTLPVPIVLRSGFRLGLLSLWPALLPGVISFANFHHARRCMR